MRLTAMLLAVLMSCAPAAGAENKPATPAAPLLPAPTGLTTTLEPLDGQGQREMIAGFELVLGDERAKTAAASQRAAQAEQAGDRKAIFSGFAGAALTAIVTLIVLVAKGSH